MQGGLSMVLHTGPSFSGARGVTRQTGITLLGEPTLSLSRTGKQVEPAELRTGKILLRDLQPSATS